MGLYQLPEIRWISCGPHLVSQYSQFIGDGLPHRKPVLQVKQRPGVGATPALADDSGQVVLGALQFVKSRRRCATQQSTVHCSSPAWKRRCCTRLSGRR